MPSSLAVDATAVPVTEAANITEAQRPMVFIPLEIRPIMLLETVIASSADKEDFILHSNTVIRGIMLF